MTEAETRLLAQHMGHDFNIHVKHYAIHSNLLERTKVAKVLTAIHTGRLQKQDSLQDPPEIADSDVMELGKLIRYMVLYMCVVI